MYCTDRGFDPGCSSFFLFRDSNKAYDTDYTELYVGDTILMGNLTLQAGLRYDQQTTKNTASSSPANPVLANPLSIPGEELQPWLPAIDFQGDNRELEWKSVSPRLGATLALGADKKTLLRAGYNHSDNPVTARDVTFNILAPGIVEDHLTLGFTYALQGGSEITMAYMHAFENSISGPSNNPNFPAGGTETLEMSESSLGIAWGKKF